MQSKVQTSKPQEAAKHRFPLYNFINPLTDTMYNISSSSSLVRRKPVRYFDEYSLAESDKVCDVT